MGYVNLSLDEIPMDMLVDEVLRRRGAWEQGVCDYCGRPYTSPPCRFPERHTPEYARQFRGLILDLRKEKP